MPSTPMPSRLSTGSTSWVKLRKCASITFRGICTASKWKSCLRAWSNMRRWTYGSLWPVKPAVHPALIGLGMDTLIHWYDLNLAEGHPDYRVLPVIKKALDGLWRDNWLPGQKMFDYNRYILPVNHDPAYTALNNLVSEAYAWYWLQTDRQ